MEDSERSYFDVERHEMLAAVPGGVRRVLDVGCGAGAFAHAVRKRFDCHVTGVEINADMAALAAQRIDRVLVGAVESQFAALEGERFDCIVFNDVLEHLVDPWDTLRRARGLLSAGGTVVASIPNVRYFPVAKAYLLQREWKYDRWGVLDQTHLRFFTGPSARRLFEDSGYEVRSQQGIFPCGLPWPLRLIEPFFRDVVTDLRFERFAITATASAGSDGAST